MARFLREDRPRRPSQVGQGEPELPTLISIVQLPLPVAMKAKSFVEPMGSLKTGIAPQDHPTAAGPAHPLHGLLCQTAAPTLPAQAGMHVEGPQLPRVAVDENPAGRSNPTFMLYHPESPTALSKPAMRREQMGLVSLRVEHAIILPIDLGDQRQDPRNVGGYGFSGGHGSKISHG